MHQFPPALTREEGRQKGLTTVFAVKDRVTGHNPMAALYTSGTYYQRLMKKGDKPDTSRYRNSHDE